MKKLALGLLLTAGICGNAWASEGKVVEKKGNKVQKAIINLSTLSKPPIIKADCIIASTVEVIDSEGNVLDNKTYYYTFGKDEECNGSVGGVKDVCITVPVMGVN